MTPKQKLDQLEREESRAEGRMDQLLQTLKKDFDCRDIDHARRLLKSLQREEKELNEQCMEAEQEFESKWDEILREEDPKAGTGERSREADGYYRKRTTSKG